MKEKFLTLVRRASASEVMRKLVFSRPYVKGEETKVSCRMVCHRSQRFFALEYTKGDTVSQKNVKFEEGYVLFQSLMDKFGQANLITSLGDVEYKISKSGKCVLLGDGALERKLSGDLTGFAVTPEGLERKKNYILKGDEPFLFVLGISDKNGRVHDKKQGKFRQINRFLEYFNQVYDALPKEGVLTVYDLCSGKSYLSFALYHHLTNNLHREVNLLSIDLKADVIRACEGYAREVGFHGMHFVCDDVKNTPKDVTPDLVISLHACDVATDIVLSCAVQLNAKVILSTPCCHRELSRHISCAPLAFATRFGKLSDKVCEGLTDGLRLLYLEGYGYLVNAYELVDAEDTPKNTLLVAIKKKAHDEKKKKEYQDALTFLLGDGASSYLNGMI
ncbi:MAG: SAM-dependent methyltransferase [Clostridia bacterium]|nr:SAM-dependent methyltransferase [Clostridia bacterium]